MRVRLKIALPLIGLFAFSAATYHSFRRQREFDRTPSRYFWWSAIRLDSDPANKNYKSTTSCKDVQENCGTWELRDRWVHPALLEQFLMLSALPAFIIGGLAVSGLGRLGVSQVSSFMFVMPALIFVWYYFVGWLLDGWIRKRSKWGTPALD
jgi:hypothetical protein